MGKTFLVSNATQLQAALDAAQGGDRIELAAGEYGELHLRDVVFGGEGVTIASADPQNIAVFDKINLFRSDNLHFDGIEIDFEPTGNTGYMTGFRAADSSNISIKNSVLSGGFDETRTGDDADAPVGTGIQITRADNILIENNEIYDFHVGVIPAYVDGLVIKDNYIHDLRTSPITGGAVNNVQILDNHFSSPEPVNFGGAGDHGDMIHFYPLTNQVGPMENILIRGNFMEQGTGDHAIMGIYIDDAGSGGSGLGYINVVIDNNILHNGDAQGLRVENVDGLIVTDNTFLQPGDEGSSPIGIVLTSNTRNVFIDNNILAGTINGSSAGVDVADALNVVIGDNLFVQNDNPSGDNYVGNLFVNGLTMNGDALDFITLEGSAAYGYGSRLSLSGLKSGQNVAVISDVHGEGLESKTITFDAQALYGSKGEIDFSGAKVTWDFGDGSTGTGDNVAHTYVSAGSYDVTTTFTFKGGWSISMDKTIDVYTADAVIMDFENGLVDSSDLTDAVTATGAYNLESGRFGEALRLVDDTSRVSVQRSDEIIENPEFSISFAFQKDGGTDSNTDDGMFVYFAGAAYIGTGDGTLSFTGTTSTGDVIRLGANAAQIEDGAWHHLTFTYSSEAGSASLYLDGEEVDNMTGITGVQNALTGHNMNLGGLTQGAFGGLMDEFEFTRAALTPEQVQARFDALFNPSEGTDGGTVKPTAETDTSVTGDETEPVRVVTICEDPLTGGDRDPDTNVGIRGAEDPMSGPDTMPHPVVTGAPAPEEEEVMPRPTPTRGNLSEEDGTIYDALMNSISIEALSRAEEGEMVTDQADVAQQSGGESSRIFRLFDLLRDTGPADETMPTATGADENEDQDAFSFLF